MSVAWIVLILSGMLEAVWASALDASKGFKKLWPSVLFVVSVTASMVGLAWAMREIPVGTAYAVWVGLGAVLTAAWAMITRKERATVLRIALLAGLIACVAGLKLVSA
ncbi:MULTISPECIES: DMT family transporter [Leucobacter]|uniref:Multidrug efflux SMR transporter n=1 Tax=Leucobacter iarius TaxID=333963 RepID=A0ABP4XK34_9MICO|nr:MULTISPECIES: multidrug efflux SMR transporter [unclassified Leucobacter]PIJ28571.1 ligand-binding protein SH3 [Leucobacter sp. OLES1]KKI22441.1 ligand-binding protein SH3 [Leucobacter sp. Ag1]PII83274.1 ligand-binding protein SH3 [Leucobacter sp. OLCALW19]PII86825.1 ligand-binding protein SH3 [Leucobacter sp. OLTLW20]PII91239.1 ligand-binding protein SH3 [Leucobacter sp. OLAS13]